MPQATPFTTARPWDAQGQRHLDMQEREAGFAGMLVAIAQENSMPQVEPRMERTIACTLERPKTPAAALHVILRVGDEEFVFDYSNAAASGKPVAA